MFKRKVNNEVEFKDSDYEDINLDSYYYNEDADIDDVLKELDKPKQQTKKKRKQEEFYVKGADLIAEIKKYQESKREDAESRGVPYSERIGVNY